MAARRRAAAPSPAARDDASTGALTARRVLVLGGDADGNLGDRALLAATCRELRKASGDVEIAVVSGDPARAAADYGARAIPPLPRGLPALARAARRADLVLVGGGGLFQDDDSLAKMPYWAVRTALVRAFHGPVTGFALGVGPLDAVSSRLCARIAFACMDRVTVRDGEAARVARRLTGKPVEVVPDPAVLLPAADATAARRLLAEAGVPLADGPLVGVTSRRWFPARRRWVPAALRARLGPVSHAGSEPLAAAFAAALDRVVEAVGAFVVFLPTYLRPHEGDDRICRMIEEAMASERTATLVVADPRTYRAVAAELRVMVAGRMHPLVLAAAAGTPIVGVGYNPKFAGFFDLVGQRRRLLDMESFVRDRRIDDLAGLILDAVQNGADFDPSFAALEERVRRFTGELVRGAG